MAKFDLKDPNTQKILLGIMVFFGIFYVFFTYSFVPQKQKIDELIKTKAEKEVRLKKAQRRAAKYDKLVADVQSQEKQLKAAQNKLPKEKDIPSIVTDITRIGNKVMSPVIKIRPQNMITKDFYAEVPITVHLEGTYHGLGSFLSQVGSLTRIINPSKLNITAIKNKKKNFAKNSTIKATMTAKTFIFLPDEEF